MYNPANPVTDSTGARYSELLAPENLRSGGLGALITHAKGLAEVEFKLSTLGKLMNNRFSLVAHELARDLGLESIDKVEYGSAEGWKCVRANGVEYREKKGNIVVI